MNTAERRKVTIAAGLIALGVLSIMLAYCRVGVGSERIIAMGYANGTDAFNGDCKNKNDYLSCINCCIAATQGMPEAEQGICIDLCTAKWGQGRSERALVDAANTVAANDTSSYLQLNQAKNFLRAARYSSLPRLSRMATLLVAQLRLA